MQVQNGKSSQHNNYGEESENVNYETNLQHKKVGELILNNIFILFTEVYEAFKYYV